MKKRKWRFVRAIWSDTVDMLMWMVTIAMFVYSLFGHDTSKFLFILIFYIFYAMFRMMTFKQQNYKFRRYIDEEVKINTSDEVLQKYDDI